MATKTIASLMAALIATSTPVVAGGSVSPELQDAIVAGVMDECPGLNRYSEAILLVSYDKVEHVGAPVGYPNAQKAWTITHTIRLLYQGGATGENPEWIGQEFEIRLSFAPAEIIADTRIGAEMCGLWTTPTGEIAAAPAPKVLAALWAS